MMPPTYLTCLEIAQHGSAASALSDATSRTVDMFTPEVISSGEDFVLSTPPSYRGVAGVARFTPRPSSPPLRSSEQRRGDPE